MDRIDALLAAEGMVLVREHPELASTLHRRFHEGRLVRLHPGVYVPTGPIPEDLRLIALCRWAPRAVLHAATGAALWLDSWTGGTVDVASPVRLVHGPRMRLTLRQIPAEHTHRRPGLTLASAAYCAAELAVTDDGRTAMRMFMEGLTTADAVEFASRSLAGSAAVHLG